MVFASLPNSVLPKAPALIVAVVIWSAPIFAVVIAPDDICSASILPLNISILSYIDIILISSYIFCFSDIIKLAGWDKA